MGAMTTEAADEVNGKMSDPDLDELGFEILKSAVNIARNEQIHRLTTLRERLKGHYPGEDVRIQAALTTWANRVARLRSHESA